MYVPWFRDGRVTFEDFGRILEPAYLDVSRKSDKPRTVDFVVPYAYARTFDTGDPIDASHYGEMEGLMADEMRRQLADNVVGLAWDKADYARAGDTRYAGLSVDRISVTGFTSPEATGPGSLEAGSTDPENVELGEIRAGDAGRRLKEVLTRLGVDSVDGIEDISGDEVQFSAEEFSELETIAESLGMNQGTTEDKIYQLLSAYNADRVTDPEVVTRLDQLVASKRFVEVTVTFKEKKKSTTLLPLPLLALLVLALRPLTRRRDAQPQPPIEPAPVGRPRIVDTLPPLDQTDNGLAYARNVEVDINGNFYFYQGIVDRYIENGTVDVNELTHDILEQWNEHDNVRRQNMGQSSIDHRTNPRQVLYAQFHAQALVRLMVEARQRGPHTPVSTVWQDRTVRQGIAQDIIDTLARLQREAAAN
ncbi:MAG: hypothetical protein ACD_41C00093G0002 [uncultured bacterium]|nr:MAG: hypothetical protein ACD_41C00093G0002 [uncultured bacterium]